MSPKKWIESTNAIGIVSKAGRYGGTFAHSDIAFEFASWISAEFKLYIIKDYQRIKTDENSRLSQGWNLRRDGNSGKKGNIRDEASIQKLLVLANMESYNAILINQGKTQPERMLLLRELAINQLQIQLSHPAERVGFSGAAV